MVWGFVMMMCGLLWGWNPLTLGVMGFNLDIVDPRKFTGPINSYFGLSVSLHQNQQGFHVLVGAPRANSSSHPFIHQPGALYDCPLHRDVCTQLSLDNSAVNEVKQLYGSTRYKYNESRSDQWLGVSVSSHHHGNGSVLVCGHRWTNQHYKSFRFGNGVCYELDGDLQPSSVHKLLPLVDKAHQVDVINLRYIWAYGQAGIDTHYSKDGRTMMLGAPGVTHWTGAVLQYVQGNSRHYTLKPPKSTPFNSYIGYSVSSGRFYNDDMVYYVTGAPRYSNVGKVFIFTGAFDVRIELDGNQLGSYFGSAICVVDLNGDGLDDILVGAPQYHGNHFDEGRVHVYINQHHGILSERPKPLSGSQKSGSRFGSAISVAGDLNADGFLDVVIGAPYENQGSGAVYIYHGGPHGIHDLYAQRVAANQIDSQFQAFGYAIDGGLDIDENGYPDIAVGAYASGSVVVLRTRPVVYLEAAMDFNSLTVDTHRYNCEIMGRYGTCLAVGIAFSFTGIGVPSEIDIEYSISVDSLVTSHLLPARGRFKQHNNTLVSSITNTTTLYKDSQWNSPPLIVLFNIDIKDIVTPIQFVFSYKLVDDGSVKQLKPVIDKYYPTEIIRQVHFVKQCGSDNICETDLHILPRVFTPSGQPYIILGQSDFVSINVEVLNRGEKAYLSEVKVKYPDGLSYIKVRNVIGEVICLPLPVEETFMLQCEIGNPIPARSTVSFMLYFDPSKVLIDSKKIKIHFEAMTGSIENETLLADNSAHVEMPLVLHSDMELTGTSRPEQFSYNRVEYNASHMRGGDVIQEIVHYYDVRNKGPGTMPFGTVDLFIPVGVRNNPRMVQVDSVELVVDGQSDTAGGECHPHRPQGVSTNSLTRHKTSLMNLLGNDDDGQPLNVSCDATHCQMYQCNIGSVSAGDSILIKLHMRVNISTIIELTESGSAFLISKARVDISNNDTLRITNVAIMQHQIRTPIFPMDHSAVRPEVKIWVVVISAVMGVFILITLALVMKRMGFFRRKVREDLQKLLADIQENEINEQLMVGQGEPSFTYSSPESALLPRPPAAPPENGAWGFSRPNGHPGRHGNGDYDNGETDYSTRIYPSLELGDNRPYDSPRPRYTDELPDFPEDRNLKEVYDYPQTTFDTSLFDYDYPDDQNMNYDYPPTNNNNLNNNYDFPPKSRYYAKHLAKAKANGHAGNGPYLFEPVIIPPLPKPNVPKKVHGFKADNKKDTGNANRLTGQAREAHIQAEDDYLEPVNLGTEYITPRHRMTSV